MTDMNFAATRRSAGEAIAETMAAVSGQHVDRLGVEDVVKKVRFTAIVYVAARLCRRRYRAPLQGRGRARPVVAVQSRTLVYS